MPLNNIRLYLGRTKLDPAKIMYAPDDTLLAATVLRAPLTTTKLHTKADNILSDPGEDA